MEYIEKATNLSSHSNLNQYIKGGKQRVPQPDDEDGFEILIDYDAELDEVKEQRKKP